VEPITVALDAAADPLAGVVESLVLVQPHLPFLQLSEPALDEGLRLGVAVVVASVSDPELGELSAEAARREGRAVV
jgi:hypothetical protein